MKLVGLYTHDRVPHLEANHRRFAELNGFGYEKVPVRNYYEKYRIIYSLLQKYPGEVFCFIDSDTYFIEDRFTFPWPDTILINAYPGEQPVEGSLHQAGMDNFFCIRAVPESLRMLEGVNADLSYRYCGDRSLDARAHFPREHVRPHLHQAGNTYWNVDIPAHPDFFAYTNVLAAHLRPNKATDYLSYADLLCGGGADFPVIAEAEFEVINPGQDNALLTLHTPEIALQGAVCERSLERYCRARGLTLYIYRRNPRAAENIAATWLKPELILRHIGQHRHIAWIDSDMLISTDCPFDTSREFTAYQDIGNWRFNAGYMIFRNCPRTLAYLEAVRTRCESLDDRSTTYVNKSDQWQFICEAGIHFPEFLPVSNRRINLLPGYEPEGEPPLLVHFVGMPTHIRARIMNCYDRVMLDDTRNDRIGETAGVAGEDPAASSPTCSTWAKPRVLVFMSDNRPLEHDFDSAGYHSLTAVINARYCKRHGYDFLYCQPHLGSTDHGNAAACLDPASGAPRHGSWAKLLAARQALSQDYDYAVYLDSDCIFTENAPGLEPVISAMGDRFIAFLSDIPNLPELPNAGFFIARVNDRSRAFIDQWYGQDLPECNTSHPWEQGALWRIFRQHDVKILRGPLYDSWMTMEGEKGQILRHIVNQFDSLRIPYFRNHIRFYSIPYEEMIRGIPVLLLDTDPESWSVPCQALGQSLAGLPSGATLATTTPENTLGSVASPSGSTDDISRLFPLYRPYSSDIPGLDQLTVQSVNQSMPFLGLIAEHLHGKKLKIMDIREFASTGSGRKGVSAIKELFDRYGSDKANYHNYHELYGCILRDRANVQSVLEIGLGTNNTAIACNMGSGGKPGASLRAFRDHFPEASIYGADIDHSILFEEERIRTFHVDQTDPESFEKLTGSLPGELDLIIDDGLHAPNANLLTFLFGVKKVSSGGWIVIEDVTSPVIWQTVASLLPENLKPYFFHAEHGMIFAVQRLS